MKCTGIGKKTLSFILAFCMVLGLLPGLSLTASAEPLENWIDSAAESFAAGGRIPVESISDHHCGTAFVSGKEGQHRNHVQRNLFYTNSQY